MTSADPRVVKGEAPENEPESSTSVKYGIVFHGEAPESDDEFSLTQKPLSGQYENLEINIHEQSKVACVDSILQRKLYESNISLWSHLNKLLKNITQSVSSKLLDTDQQLLKCQVTFQSALTSVKLAKETSQKILSRTEDILTANFLPVIRAPL